MLNEYEAYKDDRGNWCVTNSEATFDEVCSSQKVAEELAEKLNKKENGTCQNCGWVCLPSQLKKNNHGCKSDSGNLGGNYTLCPQCGWCGTCDEVKS